MAANPAGLTDTSVASHLALLDQAGVIEAPKPAKLPNPVDSSDLALLHRAEPALAANPDWRANVDSASDEAAFEAIGGSKRAYLNGRTVSSGQTNSTPTNLANPVGPASTTDAVLNDSNARAAGP